MYDGIAEYNMRSTHGVYIAPVMFHWSYDWYFLSPVASGNFKNGGISWKYLIKNQVSYCISPLYSKRFWITTVQINETNKVSVSSQPRWIRSRKIHVRNVFVHLHLLIVALLSCVIDLMAIHVTIGIILFNDLWFEMTGNVQPQDGLRFQIHV